MLAVSIKVDCSECVIAAGHGGCMQQGSLAGAAAGTLLSAHGNSEGTFALDTETLMSIQKMHAEHFSIR